MSFHRIWEPCDGAPEVSDGTAYYRAPGITLVHVRHPVEQILEIEGEHLRIYYPQTREAFDILTQESGLPFISIYLDSPVEDFGLGQLGYVLDSHRVDSDTTITSWSGPQYRGETTGSAILARLGDELARLDLLDKRGRPMIRYTSRGKLESGGWSYPAEMETRIWSGQRRGRESVAYRELAVNDTLPGWVLRFQLPENASVRDLR